MEKTTINKLPLTRKSPLTDKKEKLPLTGKRNPLKGMKKDERGKK